MTFTAEQIAALKAPLDRSHVKQRTQSGRSLSYVEGWHSIAEANRIFGFDGWTRETVEYKCVAEGAREIGAGKAPGYGVSYIAKVRVRLLGGADVIREGLGTGHGIDRDLGLAHESAIKEAETDAMKRALMTFGNPFGLALYDKEQKEVVDAPAPPPVHSVGYKTAIRAMKWAQSRSELKDWYARQKDGLAKVFTDQEKADFIAEYQDFGRSLPEEQKEAA